MQDIREKKRDWIHSRTLLLLNLTHENTRIHTVITQDINPASNPSHIFTIIQCHAITHLLPRSQHCREHQAGEGQQQTQCPGQIVTPLRYWSESSPFQAVNDVVTTAGTRPRCMVTPAFLPFSLKLKLLSLRCLITIVPLNN